MRGRLGLLAMAAGLLGGIHGARAAEPVVLELFTSQGCSSCPPAEALLGSLSGDASLLPLLFHVSYWDNLGWKDPYASPESTGRQYAYSRALGSGGSVFTPQLIVNGTESMVGSDERKLRKTISAEKQKPPAVRAALAPDPAGSLSLSLSGAAGQTAEIWEVRFVSHATTRVGAGENGGRTLVSVNNVTSLKRLGDLPAQDTSFALAPLKAPEDGLAVIVQEQGQGRILGSAVYMKQ